MLWKIGAHEREKEKQKMETAARQINREKYVRERNEL